MTNLEDAAQKWQIIRCENDKEANTAARVGDAGLAILELLPMLDYVPITGTAEGAPITGNLVFDDSQAGCGLISSSGGAIEFNGQGGLSLSNEVAIDGNLICEDSSYFNGYSHFYSEVYFEDRVYFENNDVSFNASGGIVYFENNLSEVNFDCAVNFNGNDFQVNADAHLNYSVFFEGESRFNSGAYFYNSDTQFYDGATFSGQVFLTAGGDFGGGGIDNAYLNYPVISGGTFTSDLLFDKNANIQFEGGYIWFSNLLSPQAAINEGEGTLYKTQINGINVLAVI